MSDSSLLLKDLITIIRREECGIYDGTAQFMLAEKINIYERYLDRLKNVPGYSVDQYLQVASTEQNIIESQINCHRTCVDLIFANLQYWYDNIKTIGIGECLYDELCTRLLKEIEVELSISNRLPLQPYNEWSNWIKQDTVDQISKMKGELEQITFISCSIHTPSSKEIMSQLKQENQK